MQCLLYEYFTRRHTTIYLIPTLTDGITSGIAVTRFTFLMLTALIRTLHQISDSSKHRTKKLEMSIKIHFTVVTLVTLINVTGSIGDHDIDNIKKYESNCEQP